MKTRYKRNGTPISEADVEEYAKKRFSKLGWWFEKFISPNRRGVPDRLCAIPSNHGEPLTFFIEFKAPGRRPTPLQKADHDARRIAGYSVYVIDCYEDVDELISSLMGH